ncbi:hypothetical protein CLV84_0576 [Neolewinella xylanilytica]|uniref:Uncharacterized protein n=1 Tax=Neolewinella xylanilytica TaxID=1514080 RepID=A0A2S6I827_9BACT|nr:hypothetical protein [Neolewinella xylanilytica]PPK87629.1 hypothetical protein CLV84_0576 [Neolewinella xylanilytica]
MRRTWFPLLLLLFLTSCPPDLEREPSYLFIEGFELETTAGEGAATSAITEVWAFADEAFIGVFPLPGRVPVFRTGEVVIRLEAGVHQDGRSITPDSYPFYTPVEQTLTLIGGETIDLGRPVIRYRDRTTFGFVEGFEPGFERVFTDPLTPGGVIAVQSDEVRSGGAAGAIVLSDANRLSEVATGLTFRDLNLVPITVWLEVDFLADAPTIFGVIGQRDLSIVRVFDPGFLPRDNWTKIYFNLSPVVGSADLPELRIALSSLLPNELGAGTVYLDNLKLLYFTP